MRCFNNWCEFSVHLKEQMKKEFENLVVELNKLAVSEIIYTYTSFTYLGTLYIKS